MRSCSSSWCCCCFGGSEEKEQVCILSYVFPTAVDLTEDASGICTADFFPPHIAYKPSSCQLL